MPQAILQLVPTRAAAFDRLPTEVRDVLRLCDGTRALPAIVALSSLPPATTERVVARLIDLGFVAARMQPPPRPRSLTPQGQRWARERPGVPELAFSTDEEAFFTSGIDHLIGDEIYED
jgi:hypothetical protein